jgi:hypothetical protein
MLNHRVGQLTTNGPVGACEAPRVHWAKRLATILGTVGVARARSTRPSESLTRPDFSEPRMFADQFQRNGVIFGLRFDVPNGDTSAVSRGEGSGFTGIFGIVAAAKAGVVG